MQRRLLEFLAGTDDESPRDPQYALICNGRLLDYVEAPNVIEAAAKFSYEWPDDAFVTNLTELLGGI